MGNCPYSNICRSCSNGSFSKYPRFNRCLIILIGNGISSYGFIYWYNICRHCFKIRTWLFIFIFRHRSIFYFFTHFTHYFISFLYYFCKNGCLYFALWNNWCVNCVIIIQTRFQFTGDDPYIEELTNINRFHKWMSNTMVIRSFIFLYKTCGNIYKKRFS